MNEFDQSDVAYEDGPKEVNTKRRMPQGDKQFGKEVNTMPQDKKSKVKIKFKKSKLSRHGEHR